MFGNFVEVEGCPGIKEGECSRGCGSRYKISKETLTNVVNRRLYINLERLCGPLVERVLQGRDQLARRTSWMRTHE
jgi:hypothetical protein